MAGSRTILTGLDERVSTPTTTASRVSKPRSVRPKRRSASRSRVATNAGSNSSRRAARTPGPIGAARKVGARAPGDEVDEPLAGGDLRAAARGVGGRLQHRLQRRPAGRAGEAERRDVAGLEPDHDAAVRERRVATRERHAVHHHRFGSVVAGTIQPPGHMQNEKTPRSSTVVARR